MLHYKRRREISLATQWKGKVIETITRTIIIWFPRVWFYGLKMPSIIIFIVKRLHSAMIIVKYLHHHHLTAWMKYEIEISLDFVYYWKVSSSLCCSSHRLSWLSFSHIWMLNECARCTVLINRHILWKWQKEKFM